MKNEYLVKLIIIGDCAVGKTNILMRYCENNFKTNYNATIGVDFKVKSIQIGQTKIKMQIWDTAGQERYINIAQTYYKGAAGIILTYSVSDEKSFKNVQKWMKQVNEHAPQNVVKIIVGNKCDVNAEQREVQKLQGRALADKFQIPFFEVSAKTGENIQQVFLAVGKKVLTEYIPKQQKQDSRMQLKQQNDNKEDMKRKECQC